MNELEYPAKLQKLLLTPEREVRSLFQLPTILGVHKFRCRPMKHLAQAIMQAFSLQAASVVFKTVETSAAVLHGTAADSWDTERQAVQFDSSRRWPLQVLVELVITRDNGEIESFNAFRVQHDNSRGPYKGGLRYHPQVLGDGNQLSSLDC